VPRDGLTDWWAWGALVLGAFCSVGLVTYVGGGWQRGVTRLVAWAMFPYLASAVVLGVAKFLRTRRAVELVLAWGAVAVALSGPLLYVDAMFIRPDAQGALVILTIPVLQLALGLVAIAAARAWQLTARRRSRSPAPESNTRHAPHGHRDGR